MKDRIGWGRRLFESIGAAVPVLGVTKRPFAGAPDICRVFRGRSRTLLYVTAAGMALLRTTSRVRAMHRGYRIPTLFKLRRANRICREKR